MGRKRWTSTPAARVHCGRNVIPRIRECIAGQLQVAKGEWEQAAEMFKCALETQPECVAALVGQACVLFNKGRVEEALRCYKVEAHPLSPPMLLAQCCWVSE